MAFAVALHLSLPYESKAAEILQNHTSMTVQQGTQQTEIEKTHVDVKSPNMQLLKDGNHLGVAVLERTLGTPASIDFALNDSNWLPMVSAYFRLCTVMEEHRLMT